MRLEGGFHHVPQGCGLFPYREAIGPIVFYTGLQEKKQPSPGKWKRLLALRRRRAREGVLVFWGERPSWETGGAVFAFWGRHQWGVVDLAATIQGGMQTGRTQ